MWYFMVMGIHDFFQISERNLQFLPFNMMLAVSFYRFFFLLWLSMFFLYLIWWDSYHEGMSTFFKCFYFYIHWNNHMILSFIMLMWSIMFTAFQMLSHSWIPETNTIYHGEQIFQCPSLLIFDHFASVFIKHIRQ